MFSLFVLAALLDLSKDQIMLCEDISANVTMLVQQILIEKNLFQAAASHYFANSYKTSENLSADTWVRTISISLLTLFSLRPP